MVKIASLNIACAGRDEKFNPLWKRLPTLCKFIKDNKDQHNFDILCVQEVRPTGVGKTQEELQVDNTSFKAYDVVNTLAAILGGWEFVVHKVNPSGGSFYRTTFWNPDKYVCHQNQVLYTKNIKDNQFPYMLMVSSFTAANSCDNTTQFKVFNCHAPPFNIDEKMEYWTAMKEQLTSFNNTVAIGDVNKFEDQLTHYKCLFDDEFPDRVPGDTLTFVSFECDTKPDGSLWRSSLDAVIANNKHDVDVIVVPTTVPLCPVDTNDVRPTDHFLLVADVNFA